MRSFWSMLAILLLSERLQATEISDPDISLLLQTSYVSRTASLWQIAGKTPYCHNNIYHDLAIKYQQHYAVMADQVNIDLAVYALAYYLDKDTGKFEQDDHKMKLLIDKLNFSLFITEQLRLDFGKRHFNRGLFYLKSPATLLNSYYAGFKSTRLYQSTMKQAYMSAFWGAELIEENDRDTLSFAIVPKLTHIDNRDASTSNWSALQRSNATASYIFTYTNYQAEVNTPSLKIKLGDSTSLAFANSYNGLSQWVINTELAYHTKQQWRHLDNEKANLAMGYQFPMTLYRTHQDPSLEFALGMQYNADDFSQFGVEYYFQSEGYSQTEWNRQTALIRFFNQRTHYRPIDKAFDDYQYLMAAEIDDISSQGYFQRKHYLNSYISFQLTEQSRIQSYLVLNLRDQSMLLNLNYSSVLRALDERLEFYTGMNSAIGRRESEFGLFGENIGIYLGFQYHL